MPGSRLTIFRLEGTTMSTSTSTQQEKRKPYKLGLKLILKFSDEEAASLNRFQEAINSHGQVLSMETLCRQAIFLAISESYRKADEYQRALNEKAKAKKESTDGVTPSRDTEGTTAEVQLGVSPNTSILAEADTSTSNEG